MKNNIKILSLLVTFAATALAQQKPDPAGIVRLFSVDVAQPENSPAWTNVNIDGMRLRPDWNDVQPSSTTYDWSAIDNLMDLATQHGKFIGLSVTAGISTPQWVYDAGATQYHLQDGSGNSMPLPWDSAFQTKWLAFVNTMGQRYDGNPALGYVVISGLGQGIETWMASTTADNNALTALGGPAAWVTAAQQIIAGYAQAFPTTPFIITASKPFLGPETMLDLQTVIDWAVATYPGRFGIMNTTLNAHSTTTFYPNLAIYTYHATQSTGFQMLCSAASDPQRLGGTLNQALTQGVLLGAKYVEVYQNDADASDNQTILQTQGEALKGIVVEPQALNLSTRGVVSSGEGVLIGGFIITGTEPKTIVLRALGPSLSSFGLSGVLNDPVLSLYNSSNTLIATNDNWQSDPHNADIQNNGLAPANLLESATFQTLAPGAYTVIVTGKNSAQGIALVELDDLSPQSDSKLTNMSTRGSVGTADDVLISGFTVGGVGSTTVVVRALGPSLGLYGVSGVLSDPTLTICDSTGTVIASNDNWQSDPHNADVQKDGLAPPNLLESAILLQLPAGAYTAIVRGANGATGLALAEVYTLD